MPIRKELATITNLETSARVMSVGSDLYRQGDPCSTYYIVLSGWIALSVLLDDGSCQILDFALPGAVLGFQSGPDAPMYHSARCLSVVRVYACPRSKLDTVMESNPRIAVVLCHQITADEARAHDHLTNLGLRSAGERIARLLLEIYVRVRRRLPAEPGEIIQLPLSQVHIGQALGLTYVHVCRTLQKFRQEKIIRFANHRLEIIDPPALIAAAESRSMRSTTNTVFDPRNLLARTLVRSGTQPPRCPSDGCLFSLVLRAKQHERVRGISAS